MGSRSNTLHLSQESSVQLLLFCNILHYQNSISELQHFQLWIAASCFTDNNSVSSKEDCGLVNPTWNQFDFHSCCHCNRGMLIFKVGDSPGRKLFWATKGIWIPFENNSSLVCLLTHLSEAECQHLCQKNGNSCFSWKKMREREHERGEGSKT